MTYEKARMIDLDEILTLYGEAISDMARRGIDQWDAIYPGRDILERDIKKGDMFTAREFSYCLKRHCEPNQITLKGDFYAACR